MNDTNLSIDSITRALAEQSIARTTFGMSYEIPQNAEIVDLDSDTEVECDEDVEVLEKPPDISHTPSVQPTSSSIEDDEVICTNATGATALIDYPHGRPDCATYKFPDVDERQLEEFLSGIRRPDKTYESIQKHCPNCYCVVRDAPVTQCKMWMRHSLILKKQETKKSLEAPTSPPPRPARNRPLYKALPIMVPGEELNDTVDFQWNVLLPGDPTVGDRILIFTACFAIYGFTLPPCWKSEQRLVVTIRPRVQSNFIEVKQVVIQGKLYVWKYMKTGFHKVIHVPLAPAPHTPAAPPTPAAPHTPAAPPILLDPAPPRPAAKSPRVVIRDGRLTSPRVVIRDGRLTLIQSPSRRSPRVSKQSSDTAFKLYMNTILPERAVTVSTKVGNSSSHRDMHNGGFSEWHGTLCNHAIVPSQYAPVTVNTYPSFHWNNDEQLLVPIQPMAANKKFILDLPFPAHLHHESESRSIWIFVGLNLNSSRSLRSDGRGSRDSALENTFTREKYLWVLVTLPSRIRIITSSVDGVRQLRPVYTIEFHAPSDWGRRKRTSILLTSSMFIPPTTVNGGERHVCSYSSKQPASDLTEIGRGVKTYGDRIQYEHGCLYHIASSNSRDKTSFYHVVADSVVADKYQHIIDDTNSEQPLHMAFIRNRAILSEPEPPTDLFDMGRIVLTTKRTASEICSSGDEPEIGYDVPFSKRMKHADALASLEL